MLNGRGFTLKNNIAVYRLITVIGLLKHGDPLFLVSVLRQILIFNI